MNNRITVTVALASAVLLTLAPTQAQAPSMSSSQLEAKVQAMQSQINALQAQVKQLQQQLRNASPSVVTGPAYQMPLPNFTVPNFNGQGFGQGFSTPNIQGPLVVPQPPSRDNSIPNYTATFIYQTAR